MDTLSNYDIVTYGNFAEPIGPNIIYTGQTSHLPLPNAYFPKWYSRIFCIEGYTTYCIIDSEMDKEGLSALKGSFGLQRLSIKNSKLPNGWLAEIAGCKQLKYLELCSCKLSASNLGLLARPNSISELVIDDVDLSNQETEFLDCLSQLKSLRRLVLNKTQMSNKLILAIKSTIPWCEVDAE